MADQHSSRSQFLSLATKVCGELVFSEATSPEGSSNRPIFEFNQPLTENTQSVSISFTSSYMLYSMISHGDFLFPSTCYSSTVGRVVRVLSVAPTSKRRTISLPIDVLLIFENLFPPTHRSWRKNILSSALACREWTCALDMLLVDFRSKYSQQGYPPEIASFVNGLVARPSLGLGIEYLSVRYLEYHPTWDQEHRDQAKFGKAFLSILRVAENVQTLCLDPRIHLGIAPDDLADALRRLSKLEVFEGRNRCLLSMAQLMSCIATWPSLKRIFIWNFFSPNNHTFPLASPSCYLTEVDLKCVHIKDDELTCLVSTSDPTLERLSFDRISQLTEAGLAAALNIVCTSLTSLWILDSPFPRDPDEEYALDATITRMVRLTTLLIHPQAASERMLERRSEAFLKQTTPVLPKVNLKLPYTYEPPGLFEQIGRDWPGWMIFE